MPRVVADDEDDITPYYSTELQDLSRTATGSGGELPTLAQLLMEVGDVRKDAVSDDTPAHHVLDLCSPKLPSLPFVLSFKNLGYSVKVHRKFDLSSALPRRCAAASPADLVETKTLLNDISGEVRAGEILAVLGASGSGKSTLIDALANRIAKGSLKGTVTVNGENVEPRMLKGVSAYVMQDDLLFPMLTVEETLMFAAEFRLPRSLPKSKKKLRVQALIDQLGLSNAANTMIGDEGHRGVSGGERRRISIGIDIIHDPIFLFLDEPTSGLDSTSAFMVAKVLKRIAQSGSIVIMSIHQPSYRIFSLLDRLIFLSCGQTVFSGSPESLPRFFSEFGHSIPENENHSEFALDMIRELEESSDGTRGLVEFYRKWEQTNVGRLNNKATTQVSLSLKEAIIASVSSGKLVIGAADGAGLSPGFEVPTYANPLWMETLVLSKRYMTNLGRMPELIITRLASVMVTGFVLATLFWRLDDSPKGVIERLGFFAFAMPTMFYSCTDALPEFFQERYIFLRETAYNAYRRSSYVISHSLVTLPMLGFLSIAFAAATFWAVGLEGGLMGFVFYFLIIFASFWSGNSFVAFISSIIPHVRIGYVISVAVLAYFMLLSGFYINHDRIPTYWLWLHYISLMKYPLEAVLQNEFRDTNKCFVSGVEIFDNTALGPVPYGMKMKLLETLGNTLGMNVTGATCLSTGSDILKQIEITQLSKWGCLLVIVAWGFFFRILFYFSLLLGSKNKRN